MTPRAQKRNPASLDGSESIAGIRSQGTLADDHEPGLGPLVEPRGVCGPSAVVRGQKDIGGRNRRRTVDQLVETKLLEITRQEESAPAIADVEHEASRSCPTSPGANRRSGAKP